MAFCKTTITQPLPIDAERIYIKDPSGYEVKNTCQAIRIGDEIIQFGQVFEEPSCKLLKCKREHMALKLQSTLPGKKLPS